MNFMNTTTPIIIGIDHGALALGRKKAVFNIGHFNMEELGMRYAQDWIGDLVDHKVPVHYLPTKDIYRYIERKHL